MAIEKALLGTGLTASVGLGVANMGFFLERESWDLMPHWKPLSEDSDFSTYQIKYKEKSTSSGSEQTTQEKQRGYKESYAGSYSRFLVGISNSYNYRWWGWSGRNRFELITDAEITPGYPGSKKVEHMKEACQKAYIAQKKDVKPGATRNKEYNEELVWFLCSPGGSKPKSISQVDKNKYSSTSGSYGQSDTHNTKLIDVGDPSNNWFWDIQSKEYEKTKTSSSLASISENNIKGWCEEAYKKQTTANNDFSETNIYKWCSLEGKKETKP